MTSNPLAARRAEPEYQIADLQARCDQLNAMPLTQKLDRFYFVRRFDGGGEKLDCIDLPTGTKGWMMENQPRVKGLIRKMTGGNPALVETIFRRAVETAPTPIPWSRVPVK